jgi:hypothetical protein
VSRRVVWARSCAVVLVGIGWTLLPEVAEACSVCFSTTEENRWAFLATTVFMSVAPLAILLGIGSWLRHKVLESERRHEDARQTPPLAPASHPAIPTRRV